MFYIIMVVNKTLCIYQMYRIITLFSKWLHHFIFPPVVYEVSDFLTSSLMLIIWFLDHSHPNVYEVIFHMVLIYIFLMLNDVGNIFTCLLSFLSMRGMCWYEWLITKLIVFPINILYQLSWYEKSNKKKLNIHSDHHTLPKRLDKISRLKVIWGKLYIKSSNYIKNGKNLSMRIQVMEKIIPSAFRTYIKAKTVIIQH